MQIEKKTQGIDNDLGMGVVTEVHKRQRLYIAPVEITHTITIHVHQ